MVMGGDRHEGDGGGLTGRIKCCIDETESLANDGGSGIVRGGGGGSHDGDGVVKVAVLSSGQHCYNSFYYH